MGPGSDNSPAYWVIIDSSSTTKIKSAKGLSNTIIATAHYAFEPIFVFIEIYAISPPKIFQIDSSDSIIKFSDLRNREIYLHKNSSLVGNLYACNIDGLGSEGLITLKLNALI